MKRLPHASFDELPTPLIEISEVSYVYPPPRRVQALDRVSFTVDPKEFVGIVGHNGSGKTTLTKCISGHLNPTDGRITIAAREVRTMPIRERPKYVGYTFQNPDDQLFKASVWDEVKFGLENLGYDADLVDAASEEILRELGLWEQRDLHPYRLSKGDRQRLSIAAVAVMQPMVLIVDEPTTGQDPVHAREIMDLLKHLRDDIGITVIVITHAMDLVAEYCSYLIAMDQGRIIIEGTPQETFAHPEVLAQTFVQPPPVVRLALNLELTPLPLTIEETAELLYQTVQQAGEEPI